MDRELDDLRELAKRLAALQEQARALGIFVGDRELLECPGCGLQEDVAFSGQLLTCLPSSPNQDTGLRFEELPGDRFRCPRCGTVVDQPDPTPEGQQG
jgi:rubredoxin